MRNRHLAAIPLAALLLTACTSATDTALLTTPTPEPTATATPTPAAGDFAWLNRHDSSFNSGDAYYEMVYRNHGGLLLKTDYATAATARRNRRGGPYEYVSRVPTNGYGRRAAGPRARAGGTVCDSIRRREMN